MEDPWGSNAWSATDSGKSADDLPKDPPKWNAFERDADENTMDVGVPSWSATTDSGWVEGPNMWHAETSTLDAWKPSLSVDEPTTVEPEEEPEEDDHKEEEEEEGEKSPEPRPILPTPPLSPLPTISVTPPSSPPRPVLSPPSPDPFGSFESAEILDEQRPEASSWTPKTPHFPLEAENEPWGGGWGGGEMEKEVHDEESKDEWALAQETRRKRDRKVPPELLESLVTQWEEFATTFYPKLNTEGGESQSWRKGLDSVDGLAELVDSLIPVTSFPPPMPFNKTAVAKSVKETLRLTRFVPMAQASPMAHLHAAKGSTDWEKSVKAQKAVANDEWGWDLKHEPEENSEPADSTKDKKSGGLLSFWSRKASSTPSTPAADPPAPTPPKSPTSAVSKATSPTTSTRPSTDSSRIASPTTATVPMSSPPAVDASNVASSDAPSAQPSAVSRFFNRFSRKPSAVTTAPSGKEGRSSISLSPDDFSFFSDVAPSTSEGSLPSHRDSSSANSLETMLSMPTTNFGKPPPPLHPPPSRPTGHKTASSQGSNLSFDAQMAEAQFMDLLDNMVLGGGARSGYAPVTADFSETTMEDDVPLPALQSRASPMDLPPMQGASVSQQSFIKEHSPVVSSVSESRSRTPMALPALSSTVAPPFTPPINNAHDSSLFSGASLPPIPPPRTPDVASRQQTIALARLDNPLPPTPKRDIDDALSFLSASPSSHSQLLHDSSPSTQASATRSLLSSVSVSGQSSSVAASGFDSSSDFGDFGDFISTPLRTPSPPKVPQKTFNSANHKPTLDLVEKAASRHGRWPASPLPSPLPQPLAPPPSSSPGLGGSSMAQSQLDFLTSDDTPSKVSSTPGTLPMSSQVTPLSQPLFGDPLSHPTSAFFNQSSAPSIPAASAFRTSTPLMPPDSQPSKPSGASGLSAQDLSFFESL